MFIEKKESNDLYHYIVFKCLEGFLVHIVLLQKDQILIYQVIYVFDRYLAHGAVISAFLTLAQAMTDQGCV